MAVVATSDQIKAGELDHLLGEKAKCPHFLADLKMSQTHWLYENGKRVLVVQKNSDKPDAKE